MYSEIGSQVNKLASQAAGLEYADHLNGYE
jgi:hypothetical protein